MKKEIRNLKAGQYLSKDGTLCLNIKMHDDGVLIEIADKDADIFYTAIVNGNKAIFKYGSVSDVTKKEIKGDKNASD